jgi:hypothetical protein
MLHSAHCKHTSAVHTARLSGYRSTHAPYTSEMYYTARSQQQLHYLSCREQEGLVDGPLAMAQCSLQLALSAQHLAELLLLCTLLHAAACAQAVQPRTQLASCASEQQPTVVVCMVAIHEHAYECTNVYQARKARTVSCLKLCVREPELGTNCSKLSSLAWVVYR